MGTLIQLADSSLPHPHGSAHIGHAIFFSRTATTGYDLEVTLTVIAALVVVGVIVLLLSHRRL